MSTHLLASSSRYPSLRPLEWKRALRLDDAIRTVTAVVALVAVATGIGVAWWWPQVFLPDYFGHGIRYWVLAIVLAALLVDLTGLVSERLEAEQFAAMHPERAINPAAFDRIGARCVLLAALTTSPVWPQIGHLWATNDVHQFVPVASTLLVHVIPSAVLGWVAALVIAAVGKYRDRLETAQWSLDCAEVDAHRDDLHHDAINAPLAVEVTDLFGHPRTEK
jgi:hypothetical protein